MAKRMLIDATHPEETRVVVVNVNRLEEFDFESSTKEQVKGNIYLARVTRVEPSLQAAFVEYGGNRHGFLAFSEIHPDYYRIPVGDRGPSEDQPYRTDAAMPEMAIAAGDETGVPLEAALPEIVAVPEPTEPGEDEAADTEPVGGEPGEASWGDGETVAPVRHGAAVGDGSPEAPDEPRYSAAASFDAITGDDPVAPHSAPFAEPDTAAASDGVAIDEPEASWPEMTEAEIAEAAPAAELNGADDETEPVETIGGDDFEDTERQRSHSFRHYKIQEVVKRRQIMLVQVTKEERGNKGAALTTYLSLAGRYCVLMPNTARGGGVSRKITSLGDRRRLKDVLGDLDIPEGMGVIVRTAGAERSKAEVKRDYEYLLRLWNEIRELTLRSTAPALIYEEGNLIKRSIRDLYTRDIDEVLVEGEEGYRTAKAFMKMLMPSHAKRVQPYRDPQIGLLHRFQVESQIDAIHSPVVQLRSGGYIVINQTEALVAIDVNSGRSTRERNIEETALRTNLEAAEEIERQLRLRDLAGLIVIDFIDMEEHRNNGAVERRLKDALKHDRARIQVGRISPFGLLEMSRQRLRPSLVEASTQPCPHCGGSGSIRSTESTALYVLRSIEEEGMRRRAAEVCVYVPTNVALYVLNQKRESLSQIESRYGMHVLVARDDTLIPPAFRLDRLRPFEANEAVPAVPAPLTQTAFEEEDEEEVAAEEAEAEAEEERAETVEAATPDEEPEEARARSRKRRRRRRKHDEEPAGEKVGERGGETGGETVEAADNSAIASREEGEEAQRRRRGRRGGRRRGRRETGGEPIFADPRAALDTVEILPTDAIEEPQAELPELIAGWPAELGVELGAEAADSGLETASLPALAGDGALRPAAETDAPPSMAAVPVEAPAGEKDAPPSMAAVPVEAPAAEKDAPPSMAAVPVEAPAAEKDAPPSMAAVPVEAPAAAIIEVVHLPPVEPPPVEPPPMEPPALLGPAEPIEAAAAAEKQTAEPLAAAPEAADSAVQAVTEKPANPRRGWWQRLIEP